LLLLAQTAPPMTMIQQARTLLPLGDVGVDSFGDNGVAQDNDCGKNLQRFGCS
jgi:hypothetical protein